MIHSLLIQNLVLIEKASIHFGPKLNIITGETGSGKSVLLSAIRLLLGERADYQLIRNGAQMAVVEAEISIPHPPLSDIELPPAKTPIRIRRELHRSGKSRLFIEEQQASLQQLKELIGRSIELVDQSSSAYLTQEDEQRALLDAFSSLTEEVKQFSLEFEKEKTERERLNELVVLQETSARDEERLASDLATIEEVNWQPEEEEKLAEEHQRLTHAATLIEKVSEIVSFLNELPSIKRFAHQLETIASIDPKLKEGAALLKSASLEQIEVAHLLTSYLGELEVDPTRLEIVENRIASIEALKKRFGKTQDEVEKKRESLKLALARTSNLETEIEECRTRLAHLQAQNLNRSNKISQKREKGAIQFATVVAKELKELNLVYARFAISLTPKPLSESGANQVTFLFAANPGSPLLPLDQSASGGELSRLLLAIKIALADKEQSSTLIFDEIDSNVGGNTASILGEKLSQLSSTRQLISVTHFVQVAKFATDHFLVSKHSDRSGAATSVIKLNGASLAQEHGRMTGSLFPS